MHALVVDARPGPGECTANLLDLVGVTATVMTNHQHASGHLRHTGEEFDLVLCDITPGGPCDGWWLLKFMHARWPSLPVVLVGAGMSDNFAPRARVGGAAGVLFKPFGLIEVREMIAVIIQSGGFYVPTPRLLGSRHAAQPTDPLVA